MKLPGPVAIPQTEHPTAGDVHIQLSPLHKSVWTSSVQEALIPILVLRGMSGPCALPREPGGFMGCLCGPVALLSWALCWALGSMGGERQDWGSSGEQEDSFKIHHLHPFPFGSPRRSKAFGFVQLAEQSHDPTESEIIKGGKLKA